MARPEELIIIFSRLISRRWQYPFYWCRCYIVRCIPGSHWGRARWPLVLVGCLFLGAWIMRRASLFSWEMSCHLCLKWQFWLRPSGRTAEGSGRGVNDGFYTLCLLGGAILILLLVRCRRIPALLSNFAFLFPDGVCPGSSVLGSLSGGLVAPPRALGPYPVRLYFRLLSPFPVWCLLLPACLHVRVGSLSVGLSSNAVISASTVITSWGSVQVVKSTGFVSSSWGVRSCLSWWVGSCCSPPISSGAFVGFSSSTVGESPDAWSCDALWGTTSIRFSTVPCRLWAPLTVTWAHV